ncbi:DUF2550 domain-containing protein [Saccharopolyspora rectivirgula]|jgi:hypothetical protein|uniref:Secreted/membrane protein n=1 Tax=Saccharopolyspora rectivirgula TaxID=28042 RepID=A0A073B647_9PSEU|nr:DUF2550 domain-containing protein [Saccharopolyspora rectivirgula]KEI43104.1 hypothetical protein GU90_18435 [Saccharopolyspora rectivirgula]
MGSLPVILLVVFVALLVAALVVLLLLWRRLRELRVGGIDVALRDKKDPEGRGWRLGIAQYRGEEFAWYRVLSLRSGPNWVINRRDVEIADRRQPSEAEAYVMPAGATVVNLAGHGPQLELAMGRDALTGFLSWLESAPPGRSVPWAS